MDLLKKLKSKRDRATEKKDNASNENLRYFYEGRESAFQNCIDMLERASE